MCRTPRLVPTRTYLSCQPAAHPTPLVPTARRVAGDGGFRSQPPPGAAAPGARRPRPPRARSMQQRRAGCHRRDDEADVRVHGEGEDELQRRDAAADDGRGEPGVRRRVPQRGARAAAAQRRRRAGPVRHRHVPRDGALRLRRLLPLPPPVGPRRMGPRVGPGRPARGRRARHRDILLRGPAARRRLVRPRQVPQGFRRRRWQFIRYEARCGGRSPGEQVLCFAQGLMGSPPVFLCRDGWICVPLRNPDNNLCITNDFDGANEDCSWNLAQGWRIHNLGSVFSCTPRQTQLSLLHDSVKYGSNGVA